MRPKKPQYNWPIVTDCLPTITSTSRVGIIREVLALANVKVGFIYNDARVYDRKIKVTVYGCQSCTSTQRAQICYDLKQLVPNAIHVKWNSGKVRHHRSPYVEINLPLTGNKHKQAIAKNLGQSLEPIWTYKFNRWVTSGRIGI